MPGRPDGSRNHSYSVFEYWFKPSLFAKSWLSANRQIFDDVIACDLWFKPSQSKILATPLNWRLPEKLFWRPFFWRTLALVSLVLGLEHSCPWPRECLSSERLSLALASDFFCVLGLGLEPCVLDSTSVKNLVLWNGCELERNVIQWDLKSFFSKNLQKFPNGWKLCPQTPVATGG